MDGRRRRCEPASQNPAYRPTRPPRTLQGRSAVPPSENVIRTVANIASMTDRGHVRFVEPLSEDAASGLGGDWGPPRRPRDLVEIAPSDHCLCPPSGARYGRVPPTDRCHGTPASTTEAGSSYGRGPD